MKNLWIEILIMWAVLRFRTRELIWGKGAIHNRLFNEIYGRKRNPLHPSAARVIDLHPGVKITTYYEDGSTQTDEIVGQPYVDEYGVWWVATKGNPIKFGETTYYGPFNTLLDALGIVPESGYSRPIGNNGFNNYYSLIDD